MGKLIVTDSKKVGPVPQLKRNTPRFDRWESANRHLLACPKGGKDCKICAVPVKS